MVKKSNVNEMGVLELINHVVTYTLGSREFVTLEAGFYCHALAKRLGLTEIQASLLSVIVNDFEEDVLTYRNIGCHYGLSPVQVIAQGADLDVLVNKGFIVREGRGFGILETTVERLRDGLMPEPERMENLTASEFIFKMEEMTDAMDRNPEGNNRIYKKMQELIDHNQQLNIAAKLKGFQLEAQDLALFLLMSIIYINENDERIVEHQFRRSFDSYNLHRHTDFLRKGMHPLMNRHLVENAIVDGQAETDAWRITDYAKREVFSELNLHLRGKKRANMTHWESISTKQLFYRPEVESSIGELRALLEPERMQRVMDRLSQKGLRRGLTCLFYGAPGTGKTETVMQLARQTRRDIMLVDIPSIRSKWVGETEKNIKAVFRNYCDVVKGLDDMSEAPILLFNEADAIFNKRNAASSSSVDKMENAMQNIVLQELETFDGILIATTNLAQSMDDAFERRFLFKVEFLKPEPPQRRHIWKAMLPDLTDEQLLLLSERYDFSGGQIENISRRRIISDILADRDELDMEGIIRYCDSEQLNHKVRTHIGF